MLLQLRSRSGLHVTSDQNQGPNPPYSPHSPYSSLLHVTARVRITFNLRSMLMLGFMVSEGVMAKVRVRVRVRLWSGSGSGEGQGQGQNQRQSQGQGQGHTSISGSLRSHTSISRTGSIWMHRDKSANAPAQLGKTLKTGDGW